MSVSYSTPEEFYFLYQEDDVAQVASPPPYTSYPCACKLPSTTADTPIPYNQIPAPHGLFTRSTEQSSPLTSNGTLFLGLYRDEGEDYLDFAGRAAYLMSSSSRVSAESSGGPTSTSGDDDNDQAEDEDMDELEQREEDIATVHHIRRTAVERLEEIYASLFLQNRDHASASPVRYPQPNGNNQKKSINKLVLRDPHFEEDDETGLTSSIAAEPVLAAILSRVASASSLPISSSATTLPSSASDASTSSPNTDVSISSLRLEDLSLPLLHTSYPEIHCPLTLLIQSPLLRELVLRDVTLESDFGGVFGHLDGLRKLELRNVGFEVGTPASGEVVNTRVAEESGQEGSGKRIYLESLGFKDSTDVVERLLVPSSQHCLAFSKLKEFGLDFGSNKARESSGKLLEVCKMEVESLRVCFEHKSDDEESLATTKEDNTLPSLADFPNLHHLELSSAYDLTSLTPYSSLLAFLDSRGAVPPGVDVKLVFRGVPIVPPCNDTVSESSIACSSSSPSPPSTTTSKAHLDALKLVHSILSRTFSKIDDTLCSLLSINTKVQIQMAFDTTVGVETFVQAHRDIVGKYAKETVDSLMSSSVFSDSWKTTNNTKTKKNSGTEGLVLLQLHEDLYVQFDPPEDEEEDDEETESVEARETRRLQDLTRRFKSLYLPSLSSKHQEVELAVELVDVYDLDEDLDQRTVEEEEVDSTESSCTRGRHDYDSDEEDSPSRLHHSHHSSRLASPFPSSSSGSSSSDDEEDDNERSPQRPLCTAFDSDSDDDEGDDGGEGLVWTSPDGETSVSRIGSTWLVRDPRLPGCAGRTSA